MSRSGPCCSQRDPYAQTHLDPVEGLRSLLMLTAGYRVLHYPVVFTLDNATLVSDIFTLRPLPFIDLLTNFFHSGISSVPRGRSRDSEVESCSSKCAFLWKPNKTKV